MVVNQWLIGIPIAGLMYIIASAYIHPKAYQRYPFSPLKKELYAWTMTIAFFAPAVYVLIRYVIPYYGIELQ